MHVAEHAMNLVVVGQFLDAGNYLGYYRGLDALGGPRHGHCTFESPKQLHQRG